MHIKIILGYLGNTWRNWNGTEMPRNCLLLRAKLRSRKARLLHKISNIVIRDKDQRTRMAAAFYEQKLAKRASGLGHG